MPSSTVRHVVINEVNDFPAFQEYSSFLGIVTRKVKRLYQDQGSLVVDDLRP